MVKCVYCNDLVYNVDLIYQIVGHSIEIWELRVRWLDKISITKSAIAKATFVRTKNHWQVYWMQ